MGVTLDQLLAGRENRWAKQQALLQENPLATLVCLTVIMPGSVKRNSQSLIVARAAVEAVRTAFGERLLQMEELDLETGYEAYLLVSLSIPEAKTVACDVEERTEHPPRAKRSEELPVAAYFAIEMHAIVCVITAIRKKKYTNV